MAKLTLADVSNPLVNPLSFQTAINNNNQLIEEAIENTLSRNGKTPNQMTSDLDMNNQDIINVNDLYLERLYMNGQHVVPITQQFAVDGVSPKQFGAKGDGVTDDTQAIKAMFAHKPAVIDWGGPESTYRTTEMLIVNWKTYWVGRKCKILFDWTVGGFCINMFYFDALAEGSQVSGIIFDHNCNDAIMPYLNNGTDLILMDAVRCGANNTTFSFCEFHRSGINGLSLQRHTSMTGNGLSLGTAFDLTNASFFPILCRVSNCYFYGCGYLQVLDKFVTFTDPELFVKGGGAGLNLLSASRNTITNCTMDWCSVGYTTDFSAGAVGNTVSNIIIEGAGRLYPSASHPFNGVGCWFGGEQNSYSNFSCVAALKHGYVISQFSRNSSFVNFMAYNAGQHGYYGMSRDVSLTNCQAINCGLTTPNTYDGFHLNVGTATWEGFNMVNCRTQSDANATRYGLFINRTTGNVQGTAVACDFQGTTSAYNLNGNTGFTISSTGSTQNDFNFGGPKFAIFGTSITNQNTYNVLPPDPSPSRVWYADGYATWFKILTDQGINLPIENNFGVSGNTFAQMLARIDDVIAANPDYCVVEGGTNDFPVTSYNTLRDTWVQIVTTLKNNGIIPIILPAPPRASGVLTTAQLQTQWRFYNFQRDYCRDNPTYLFCDYMGTWVNQASATSDPLPDRVRADGVHPNSTGAYYMGKALADLMRPLLPSRDPSFLAAADIYSASNPTGNLVILGTTNLGLLSGTGGTESPNAGLTYAGTGFASGSFFQRTAATSTATVTLDKENPRTDEGHMSGERQIVEIDAAAGGSADEVYTMLYTLSTSNISTGDWYYAEASVEVTGAPVNVNSLELHLFETRPSDSLFSTDLAYHGVVSPTLPPVTWKGVLRTAPTQRQSDATAIQVMLRSRLNATSGASITYKVGDIAVRKIA